MTRRTTAALTGAALLLTAACSGDPVKEQAEAEPIVPQVTITPTDGTGQVKPDSKITVTVVDGTLQTVTAKSGKKAVEGELSADGKTWTSTANLKPSATYSVAVTAAGGETPVNATSTFKTLKPKGTFGVADITPMPGETVGVGMPITVTFDRDIDDKKSVEKALKVYSEKPAVGAWYWTADNQAIFRTKNDAYWKANQDIRFEADLTGVKAASGVYGTADKTQKWKIGDSQISTVDTKKKYITVVRNGKKVKHEPISAGKGGRVVNGIDTYLTTSGTHLTMSAHRVEVMTSEWMGVDPKDTKNGGYKEVIPFAVRISNSGEYVHSMAARVWAMGRYNLSHGCVNSPPAFAEWFFNNFQRGDVVEITGTKRRVEWNNGWSYYEMPWKQWVKGGALDKEITTGPVDAPAEGAPTAPTGAPTAPSPTAPVTTAPATAG
ncbi:lipoprotein-anchoring transpeptidase ErfK/SrfK [Actinocorallia herbida]|uniref:Lipoprotein-anchoring transpeptidase ErfK/SrfK n=1 Tax=Actinocorallia herbida TaxID=58109 RepID=A0A3N1CU45_9ACTN|nr:Ig-like domain-containing protein [Actinocorallia herbida]ROO84208.1 lipoprotein-anchoring transpeptidase ErfK/SrfK [Actinocorallia herbida]